MSRRVKILLVAYVFPPALGSGTFRAVSFANNLVDRGFDVSVLTASDYVFDATSIDLNLCNRLDSRVEVYRARRFRSPKEFLLNLRDILLNRGKGERVGVHRVGWSKKRSTRAGICAAAKKTIGELLSYPDDQIGWALSACQVGRRIIREKKIDAVLATGGPWSCLLVGILLKRLARTPVVLDFRDPWVSNPNTFGRSAVTKKLNAIFERVCVRNCDAIIANTAELRQDFLHRYSFVSPARIHTVTNGIDSFLESVNLSNERFTITHAGALYQGRSPARFLSALRDLIIETRIPADKIRVNLVGEMVTDDHELASLMLDKDLKTVVHKVPGVSHDRALEYQSASDVLMLIQPDFPLQIPRKFYEYLAFQRPILAITSPNGATANMIRKSRAGIVVNNEVQDIKAGLLKLYQDWANGSTLVMPRESLLAFDNRALTAKVGEIIKKHVVCTELR